jgi:surfeit locus 1 family protein
MARPHPVPLIAGVVVGIVTLLLGNWQVQRAGEKSELQQLIEAGADARPVSAVSLVDPREWLAVDMRGEWRDEATIYLDNRPYQGRPGYQVLTPLRLGDGAGWVLVNRGWIAQGANRSVLPKVAAEGGTVGIEGKVRWPERNPFTLAAHAADGRLWQYIDLADYRDWSGLSVRDWIVYQTSASNDGLVRDWPRPDAGIDRHRGYAFQWYALAGLSFVLTGIYVFRSFRNNAAS